MKKYSVIPTDTFKELVMNAGVLCTAFDPATGSVRNEDIVGATSGGNTFEAKPNFSDLGDDIDNCPKNTMELKQIDDEEVSISGSMVTVNANLLNSLMVSTTSTVEAGVTHIVPKTELSANNFKTLWWIGDYSDKNTGQDAGFLAIKVKNALSTGGFKVKTDDKKKATFDYEYTAHYSIENPEEVPYEVYLKTGGE
jgi:hypothetical protein